MGSNIPHIEDDYEITTWKGSQKEFKKLFLKYYAPLSNFAYSYIKARHGAEEVVQEVFANIWENKYELDPAKNIRSYLFQSVKNKALDYLDKAKTRDKYLSEFEYISDQKVYQQTVKVKESDFEQRVQQEIKNLPDGAQKIYTLSRRDGLTYKEIADVLDISVKTVESQISRALSILRKQLS